MESEYLIQRRKKLLGLSTQEEEKKTKPIKQFSDKRQKVNKEYREIAKAYLVAHPKCEVKYCRNVSEDIHHQRGRIGDLLTDEKYFLAVCRDHHTRIECEPEWAKENGYSLSRLKNA